MKNANRSQKKIHARKAKRAKNALHNTQMCAARKPIAQKIWIGLSSLFGATVGCLK